MQTIGEEMHKKAKAFSLPTQSGVLYHCMVLSGFASTILYQYLEPRMRAVTLDLKKGTQEITALSKKPDRHVKVFFKDTTMLAYELGVFGDPEDIVEEKKAFDDTCEKQKLFDLVICDREVLEVQKSYGDKTNATRMRCGQPILAMDRIKVCILFQRLSQASVAERTARTILREKT